MIPLLAPIFAEGRADDDALSCGADSLAYGELRRRVGQARAVLGRCGVGPGDRVALCQPKSVATVVAMLAVMAAGAACAPLDPRQSAAQLDRVLRDLQPALLIAPAEKIEPWRRLAPAASAMRFALLDARDGSLDIVGEADGEAPAPSEADVAMMLYTSGSTGAPKGIMLSQANIESFVDWGGEEFAIRPSDRLVNHAPLHFDLSIFDLFCGLGRGASVHLIDETTALFAGALRKRIEAAGATVWYSAPTALAQLQERRALRGLDHIRLVLFAGEVFPTPTLRRLMQDLPQATYANLYGPTETNVCVFHRLVEPPASDLDVLPIGRPCRHCEVGVLDDSGAPVRPGEIGEICVAGPSVMRGYWRRQDAFPRADGWKPGAYRTGDYGFVRGDGELMLTGRRDQQVKVRGRRIELLALESVLSGHPGVREAAASTSGGLDDAALVAFVVARGGKPADLRDFVLERLPPHYSPDHVEWLDQMPRNANGKIDRARLRDLMAAHLGPPQ